MVGQACPCPRSDLFGARINVMTPLLTILLLSQHRSSCDDGAVEHLLPCPSLPLLKSALFLNHRCLICFFIKIHGLTRFTTIYSFSNNDNNDPPCATF